MNASVTSGLICFSHVTHEVTEDFSPRDPKSVVKQDGGGCPSATPALPLPELEREEEKEDDISDPLDLNPCSATYSNLGKCKCQINSI